LQVGYDARLRRVVAFGQAPGFIRRNATPSGENRSSALSGQALVADGLINLRADEQTLKDAELFFNWFKSGFIPRMEEVYGDLSADVS
jgi:hypothetical protein